LRGCAFARTNLCIGEKQSTNFKRLHYAKELFDFTDAAMNYIG
jgi:hypothetical protein